MSWRASPQLAEAAAIERDRRAANYPPRIHAGTLDVEAATLDWQCWTIIAEWLADGSTRWLGTTAGDDPEGLERLAWHHCRDAADKALVAAEATIERAADHASADQRHRRDMLCCIAQRVAAEADLETRTAAFVAAFTAKREQVAA